MTLLLTMVAKPSYSQELVLPAEQVAEAQPGNVSGFQADDTSGFWYVTTRHSPQVFNRGPVFRPGVARYEEGIGFRNTDFETMKASLTPGVPICVMVHGSFVDTPSTWKESVPTWRWIRSASRGAPVQMIYFTWPSERAYLPTVALDVHLLGRRAERNGYYLAEFLQHLPAESPVCFLGHSHGTRVISSGLHLLAGGTIQRTCHPWARVNGRRLRAVYAASAIDHDWLLPGQRYDRALQSAECILNLQNYSDPALLYYPLRIPLLSARALGRVGLTPLDRERLGPRQGQVVDWEVTRAIGPNHLWPHYFTKPNIAMAMRNYVYFPEAR